MDNATEFLSFLRGIIREEIKKTDSTIPVMIESVNIDGTLNVYIIPDKTTIVKEVINASKYEFKRNDIALLYKIQNKLEDSFVIAKYKP